MRAHENILVFYDSQPTYNPQKTEGHERKVSTAHHKRNSRMTTNYGKYEATSYDSTERYPRSVLKFSRDTQKCSLHPTQKPVALVEYMIKTYSSEGDTVLDPTAGVLTTAVAAARLGRKFICIEKDAEYLALGEQRLASAAGPC